MEVHTVKTVQTDPTTLSQPLRGIQLPPIQTTFPPRPFQRPQRPRVEQIVKVDRSSEPAPPLDNAVLGRKPSRGIIPTLFGRNRSHKSTQTAPKSSVCNPEPGTESTDKSPKEGEKLASVAEGTSFTQEPKVVHGISRSVTSSVEKRPSKGARGKSFRKELTAWDPPPLFQAYPQAIKHATLPAPVLSADAILRQNKHKEVRASKLPPNVSEQDLWDANSRSHGKKPRTMKKNRGSGQDLVADSNWTQKVYVLVTSGYILQYAGEGNFDRLPEKILPLGKESAAFASDAIPGNQWVLQVAHEASEDDGSFSTQGPNSVLKKLGFSQEGRRAASNFLLVIDCPEEMSAWLVAVRKEIESLGGKKYLSDASASKDHSEAERKLQQKPSQRYLVKRDPQFSDDSRKPLPHGASMATVPKPAVKDSYTAETPGHRKSLDAPSVSNTTVSGDQNVLDKLRETPRMSYMSAGTKTMSTSPGSSPGNSPVRATSYFENSEKPHEGSVTEVTGPPKACRASTNFLSSPPTAGCKADEVDVPQQRRSLFGHSSEDVLSASPPPNFSVPNFSKRYSTAASLTQSRISSAARAYTALPPVVMEDQPTENCFPSNEASVSPRISPKTSKSLGNLSTHYSPPPPPPVFSFVTESKPGELMLSSESSSKVPRRFSSLEYSRGISPVPALQTFPKPLHPPPTSALPDIPCTTSTVRSPGSARHSMQPMISLKKEERNARRPISMQVHSPPIVRVNQSSFQIVSKHVSRIEESTISSTSSTIPESPDRGPSVVSIPRPARSAPLPPLESEVQSRKDPSPPTQVSFQVQSSLQHSPRPPPPNMPSLPRLPSVKVSQRGFRGSFDGPWSSGYATERKATMGLRAT